MHALQGAAIRAAIAVVDADNKLVGIITDRDICMAAMFQAKPLHAIPVAAVMTRQVYTCDAGDSIEAAKRMMQLKQVRRVPVLADSERPVGILSINDIAQEVGAARKNRADREVVQTLAAICEPHAHALQIRPS
jgi:signal-transduction protein with cAMP-binding, CBS, and nucleotidyltransferase domain